MIGKPNFVKTGLIIFLLRAKMSVMSASMDEKSIEIAAHLGAGYPLIELITWEEERALGMVREAAASFSRSLTVWSAASGFGDKPDLVFEDPREALTRISAVAEPRVFALFDFHPFLDDPVVVRKLRELALAMPARKQAVVLISPVAAVPLELEKDAIVIDLLPPGPAELKVILDNCLKKTRHGGELIEDPGLREAVIRAAQGLTGREFQRLMTRLLSSPPDFSRERVRDVLEEKRQVLRRSEMLEFYEINQTLSDVGGLDQLKKWLSDRAEAFGPRAREYGLPEPKGLLLLGVQGCGKSLSAKAVAGLWGLPLLRLDLSAILDRETEGGQLRRALRVAESLAPCVLWVDEIEKGFSKHRVSGKEEQGSVARAFAAFLIWLQEKRSPVYVIATANAIAEMPPELLRKGRFDDIFFVDLPQEAERHEIFRIHLEKRKRRPEDFDLPALARASDGFSGSELEQVIISAMFEAFTAGRELETKDLQRAIQETVPLSSTMEEAIKELRDWAKNRARRASLDTKLMDLLSAKKQ